MALRSHVTRTSSRDGSEPIAHREARSDDVDETPGAEVWFPIPPRRTRQALQCGQTAHRRESVATAIGGGPSR